MALNSYANLTVNGTELTGDTSIGVIGGEDVSSGHIEVFEVRWGSVMPPAGAARGRLEMQPVVLTKRVDQTTPLLYQAMASNGVIMGTVKLFDTHPDSGETRLRFTLTLGKGRVQSIASCSPDGLDPAMASRPAREVVTISVSSLTYADVVGSTEYTQDITGR